jgi:hypothetical protein
MRTPRDHFPPGAVRECLDAGDVVRWDFAWRDPASGRVTQCNVLALSAPELSEDDFATRVREPAIACIEREAHRKCGMRYAMANQYHLSLPRGVPGKFV